MTTENRAAAGTTHRPIPPMPATADDEILFASDPSVRTRRRETAVVLLTRVLIAVALLLTWDLVSGTLVSEYWISNPSDVASAIRRLWEDEALGSAIVATLTEAAVGFVVGAGAAFVVGIALAVSRVVARITDPYMVAFYSIPRVALIPLLILWFGVGFTTKVVFTALLVFFPVFMNTLAGARSADNDLIDVLRVMGASKADVIRKVLIPTSLAWVFAGLRISVPFALIGAVVAEMFTSNQGLGYLISATANQFDTAGNFAVLFVTTLVGLLMTGLVALLERHFLRWQPPLRQQT
jgi:NitT/TauT family transport system permease protein